MHHADGLAVECGLRRGLERKVHFFGDGERVHVGAERDHRPGLAALEHADDARLANFFTHLHPHGSQRLGDDLGRAHFAVAEFRVFVEITPPGDDFRHDGCHVGVEVGRSRAALRTGGSGGG